MTYIDELLSIDEHISLLKQFLSVMANLKTHVCE